MTRRRATTSEVDGQPVVRFERTFPHPVGRSGRRSPTPSSSQAWFPTTVEFDEPATPGAPIDVPVRRRTPIRR